MIPVLSSKSNEFVAVKVPPPVNVAPRKAHQENVPLFALLIVTTEFEAELLIAIGAELVPVTFHAFVIAIVCPPVNSTKLGPVTFSVAIVVVVAIVRVVDTFDGWLAVKPSKVIVL